jgi:hypothetical protein
LRGGVAISVCRSHVVTLRHHAVDIASLLAPSGSLSPSRSLFTHSPTSQNTNTASTKNIMQQNTLQGRASDPRRGAHNPLARRLADHQHPLVRGIQSLTVCFSSRFMPTSNLSCGVNKIALVMARLVINGEDRLHCPLSPSATPMSVLSVRLPLRSGASPLDFSMTLQQGQAPVNSLT